MVLLQQLHGEAAARRLEGKDHDAPVGGLDQVHEQREEPLGLAAARDARDHGELPGDDPIHLGDSKNTARGCCLDLPRFEESLNN